MSEQFMDLFRCMGHFHWICVLLGCQGKLLRESGPDDALIEVKSEMCQCFGVWLQLVAVVKHAIAAGARIEENGNQHAARSTVDDPIPTCAECDCINYDFRPSDIVMTIFADSLLSV